MIGLLIVLSLYWARPILIPIALATLLAILLSPVVRGLEYLHLPRVLAVLVTVAAAGGVLCAVVLVGSRQVTSLIAELPENSAKIIAKVKTLKSLGSGLHLYWFSFRESIHRRKIAAKANPQDAAPPHPGVELQNLMTAYRATSSSVHNHSAFKTT